MSSKSVIMLCMAVGSVVGGIVPSAVGAGVFSAWGIVSEAAGGLLGIWIGYKLANS